MTVSIPRKKVKPIRLKQYRFRITALGFAILLLLPSMDQWFGFSSKFKSTEKRILAPFPTFRFPHIMTFIHEFDQYYKENFGWRNALFHTYSYWKLVGLGKSPLPEKVVVGKNGWFYPGNSLNRVADQHQGICPLPLSSMKAIAEKLAYFQRQLAEQNTKLYLLVAPDSYSVYPENLPDFIKSTKQSNFDLFKHYLNQHTSIPLIDVYTPLIEAKKKRPVYCQTDTHWNDFGSLVASLAMVNRVRNDFPQLPLASLDDYRIKVLRGMGGDLTTMLALNKEFRDSVTYKIKPVSTLAAYQIENTPNSQMGLASSRFIGQHPQLPKLLMIGDSFSFSMNQFVPNYFGKTYIVRNTAFDLDLVKAEQPDIVVLEIVERNINLLVNY
ncbi:hypothetical protein WBJ53_00540 [Spirosoma sp. SC4-14]|uniref:alginate O-acetyltransferase AlgX-related protein n=1 Tax=Spirosoma sp. SC4-14 TaxID=3128900 RepID=UPI0030D5F390